MAPNSSWQEIHDIQPEMWGQDAGGLLQVYLIQRMQLENLKGGEFGGDKDRAE